MRSDYRIDGPGLPIQMIRKIKINTFCILRRFCRKHRKHEGEILLVCIDGHP
jgi:hypothetical protein